MTAEDHRVEILCSDADHTPTMVIQDEPQLQAPDHGRSALL